MNSYKIQDSKSLFISIKNDNNKGNQYLFSINSFYSMVELYDLNNKDNYYRIWSFNEFFSLDEHDYYFPFEYELFEIKKSSKYIIAFIPVFEIEEIIIDLSFIKLFSFKSFEKDAYEEISKISYKDYLNNKIINIFLLENPNILVILSINKTILKEEEEQGSQEDSPTLIPRIGRALPELTNYPEYSLYKFNLKFYNKHLTPLLSNQEVIIENDIFDNYQGEDLFIKSLNLNDLNEQFVIFLYYIEDNSYLVFDLYEINILNYNDKENKIKPKKSGFFKPSN